MRSAVIDVLPAKVRRALKKLGTDLTLARTLLGYEPRVGPEEGLRRTIDFFKG